jgi:hypothetical protein
MSGGARSTMRRAAEADDRGQYDDSLIDGGDAAAFSASFRGDDARRDGERPWPRPPPGVPPPFEDEAPRRIVRVVSSLFPHKKPTVFFDYPSFVGTQTRFFGCEVLLRLRTAL